MPTSPNPTWKPGDKIKAPGGRVLQINPADSKIETLYKFLIGSIVPRPIAFVSTVSAEGLGNLAPFSFFNGVCSNPPCIMISIARKPDGEKKDSLKNIEATGQFVVNSVNKWLVEPMVHCAGSYPYGLNEMEIVGLTPVASEKIKPMRVGESAIQMECELYKSMEIGEGGPGSSTVIIGRVLLFHVLESVYKDEKILLDQYQPVARLGGINYCLPGEQFAIPIPQVK